MRKVFLSLLSIVLFFQFTVAQTTQTTFGKNRIQYHEKFEEWLLYETPNFVTFWYGFSRNIGQSALQMAELDFSEVQNLLGHQSNDKIELIVFTDLSDLKQSNLGSEEVFSIKVGETKVLQNKVFIFFDGNHNNLRHQIREGIAGVLLNEMLFGSNLQEIVQNAVLLNLPGWFTSGLTSFCGQNWSVELDNTLKDLLLSGNYKSFDKLARQHPRLAGHAFWYYVSLNFSSSDISNFLYVIRIHRSIDRGFNSSLSGTYREFTDNLLKYYKKRYKEDQSNVQKAAEEDLIKIKNKCDLPLLRPSLSPDGKRMAFVRNDIGKWKVFIKDFETGKQKCIMKQGIRNKIQDADYNYPIIAWHPDNIQLAILTERRDVAHLTMYDTDTGKKQKSELAPDYQRVFSMSFINPFDLVLSASVQGFTDVFIYHTVTRQSERITQDFYDDLDAQYAVLDGMRGVLFSSNRTSDTLAIMALDTILPLGTFGIYFYNLDTRSKELIRIANVPYADAWAPVSMDSTHFAYLSQESGIQSRFAGYLEPYIAFYRKMYLLKDGAEVQSYAPNMGGEWAVDRVLGLISHADSVALNLDSLTIDSIYIDTVFKKRAIIYNQTSFDRSITAHTTSTRSGHIVFSQDRFEEPQFFRQKINTEWAKTQVPTTYRRLELKKMGLTEAILRHSTNRELLETTKNRANQDTIPDFPEAWEFQVPEGWDYSKTKEIEEEPEEEIVEKQKLQTEGLDDVEVVKVRSNKKKKKKEPSSLLKNLADVKEPSVLRFNPSRIVPYRLRFRTNYVSTSIDNNLLFEGLESFAGSPQGFRQPPPGLLLKANFSDLFEDYVIETGFRVPTTFNGAEYYLLFDNKKKRMDKRIALYRRTTVSQVAPTSFNAVSGRLRTNTLLGQYQLRYPLNVFMRVQATGTLRQDRTFALSTERAALTEPAYAEQRASVRLEWVYDNTLDVDMNIKNGSRAKVFVEAVKRFEFNTQPEWDLNVNKGFMGIIGLDARHYQRLDKRSILALRLAGATTFGAEQILYYMGGIDNWIFPKFNDKIPVDFTRPYAFEALATNLRGFRQNIRNGNSFAVANAELRIPVFKYLFWKRTSLGSFWRNFQVIGFFDAGTAWAGKDPFDGDNPINTLTFENPPTVNVSVNYFRDPLVAGYGVGVRTLLFGMYLRGDYAWGIETREVQPAIFHLGLGVDF